MDVGGMTAAGVAVVVSWLEREGAVYQVNGGWSVDALVGRQTRVHRDVDVFLDESAVPALTEWLEARGYSQESDELPVRVELRHGAQVVDVHPMRLDEGGNGTQIGDGDTTYLHSAADRTTG